jgi:hypothetical protein
VDSLEVFQMSMPWKKSTTLIKQLLLRNPNLTPIELHQRLEDEGLHLGIGEVSNVRIGFLADIRIIQNSGHWVDIEGEPVVHVRRPKRVCGWVDYEEWRRRHPNDVSRKPYRTWYFLK